MRTILTLIVGVLSCAGAAKAESVDACNVAAHLVTAEFPLPHVRTAIAKKRLDILVIGSTSSTLADPSGSKRAYPARLEAVLTEKLPGVTVATTSFTKPRQTAAEMEKEFEPRLATDKPALVIWQTGTVDAMRRLDIDEFSSTLDDGIEAIKSGESDVVLMNQQYSPRTELMVAVSPYAEAMRFVALQHGIPLFDRFSVMKHWDEMGTFDLNEVTKKIDTAARVHDCIGRLLADLVIEAAKSPDSQDSR